MSLKLSHSQCNRYAMCPTSYKYHYIERIRPTLSPSSLLFGSALDSALNELLKPERGVAPEDVFIEAFTKAYINNVEVYIPDYPQLTYANSDLDFDLISISSEDREKLENLQDRKKKYGLDSFTIDDKKFYNEWNWKAMKAKGLLMLQAYRKKVVPLFKRVLAVQVPISLTNGEDSVIGFVDVIAEVEGEGVVIFDNKTSSMAYEDDSVITSPQLSLYMHALYGEYKTRKAGYIVLRKQIKKNRVKTCTKCGYDGTGARHTTCNNTIEGKRCGGAWAEAIDPEVDIQVIIDEIPTKTEDIVIDNYDAIAQSIKHGVFHRNLQSCKNYYGSKCPYFDLCYKGSKKGMEVV